MHSRGRALAKRQSRRTNTQQESIRNDMYKAYGKRQINESSTAEGGDPPSPQIRPLASVASQCTPSMSTPNPKHMGHHGDTLYAHANNGGQTSKTGIKVRRWQPHNV